MEVNKQCLKYITQTIFLVVILNILGNVVMRMRQWEYDLTNAMAASMVFVLVVDIATILIWRWVVKKHKNMLPSFFTGVSGFRFFGALLMMTVWYLAVGRESIMTFVVVFFVYYMASVIHHSIFFSKVSNRV